MIKEFIPHTKLSLKHKKIYKNHPVLDTFGCTINASFDAYEVQTNPVWEYCIIFCEIEYFANL